MRSAPSAVASLEGGLGDDERSELGASVGGGCDHQRGEGDDEQLSHGGGLLKDVRRFRIQGCGGARKRMRENSVRLSRRSREKQRARTVRPAPLIVAVQAGLGDDLSRLDKQHGGGRGEESDGGADGNELGHWFPSSVAVFD